MVDVITVGSATIDVFMRTETDITKLNLGEKVLVDCMDIETGGGGTNSAVALSRLGLNVKYLGKLGSDKFSNIIEHNLKEEKVKLVKIEKDKKHHTPYSVILNQKGKDRVIFAFKGSANHLDTFPKNEIKDTKWIYLASMMGRSFNTVKKMVNFAHKNNVKILFNPSNYLSCKGVKYLISIINKTEILVMNKDEALELLNKRKCKIETLLIELHKLGPKTVVITDGAKGAFAYDGTSSYSVKPLNVKVVQTAGAGDAFTAGFLTGIIKKDNIHDALKIGMANAASVVQHYGTKNKLLNYKEAENMIKKHNCTIKERLL